MFVITLKDHPSGIFSVFDAKDERIVPLFEDVDDALRYVMQLGEDEDNPDLQILNVKPDEIIHACRLQGQKYSIITKDELIIPPEDVIKESK
tara:strand:+ start:2108 stop:2383 length:276 start_codon:yes stop_codon:yes gene_type:complete